MTRQIHDQFAKEYLEELLGSLGTIKKSKKVKSEVQEIDVWFEPASSASRTELPGSSRLCVIIFAYEIVKCLLGKTFRNILLNKLSV